jgi:hypothetical protein
LKEGETRTVKEFYLGHLRSLALQGKRELEWEKAKAELAKGHDEPVDYPFIREAVRGTASPLEALQELFKTEIIGGGVRELLFQY